MRTIQGGLIMHPSKQLILDAIRRDTDVIVGAADAIFDRPETIFQEQFASRTLMDILRGRGFDIQEGVAGMPTAFVARYGSGGISIGFLAEYDAVSGVSQAAGVARKQPVVCGGPGHGCGHNLLGAGALGAALAAKEYLETTGRSGRVVLFGCPAEEGGAGKGFMARDGVFEEVDCALTWHPADINSVARDSSLANIQLTFRFQGTASHAALSPEHGRSALDALELMNMGVQFLREHIVPEARVHYAILDAGGTSPNVVQATASALYLIRAPKNHMVADIHQRVSDIARGAALMTGTTVEETFGKACSSIVPNLTLEKLLQENMELLGCPAYTPEEEEFAQALRATFGQTQDSLDRYAGSVDEETREHINAWRDKPLYGFILPLHPVEGMMPASSDVGDVSWVCPVAQCNTVTMAALTSYHSWQLVAQGKSSIAHKGTIYASQVLAAAAVDLFERPELAQAAKEEHNHRLGGVKFVSPIPKDVKPNIPG